MRNSAREEQVCLIRSRSQVLTRITAASSGTSTERGLTRGQQMRTALLNAASNRIDTVARSAGRCHTRILVKVVLRSIRERIIFSSSSRTKRQLSTEKEVPQATSLRPRQVLQKLPRFRA